jgi:hypothetical protein
MKQRRIIREADGHLESPKADSPEKTGEMADKYELYWSEINNEGEIDRKDKKFDNFEKFDEFKKELESSFNFLQIDRQVIPANMDAMEGPKSEEMEKIKLKENVSDDAKGIAAATATRADAVQNFIDTHNLDSAKLHNFLKKAKFPDRRDFISALAGKPGNKMQKDLINKFTIRESKIERIKGLIERIVEKEIKKNK